MDENLLNKIAEGVHRREYSLLLGAGSSLGSYGGDNQPLPSGSQLRDLLVQQFSITNDNQEISLSRAYAYAKRRNPDILEEFISHRFTNCTPTWHHILPELDWHRIWTLNIDDTVEQAYRRQDKSIDRFNWTSTFRDTSTSNHQIIHLHGFANYPPRRSDSTSEVVFSMSEYLSAVRDSRSWHAVFADEFADQPMIILGASLYDEFDLHQALHNSSSLISRGFPSVIVLTEFSQIDREEFESYGLTVVRSTAADFMTLLHGKVKAYRSSIGDYYNRHLDAQSAKFLQQFIDLREFRPPLSKNSRGFYEGYEPQWRNILDNDDAMLEPTEKSLRAIRDTTRQLGEDQAIYVLTGAPATGKSTGLLRIARELISDGLFAFQFRGDERPDVDAIVEWLRKTPNTVLIFNDCADFAFSLGDLADECAADNTNLLVVGSERFARRKVLYDNIASRFLRMDVDNEYSLLSDRDISALLRKLESRRRLGRITRQTPNGRFKHFRSTSSRRLFDGMASLESGQGFRQRIRTDYRGLADHYWKRVYAASSIAYQFGYPLSLGVASKVAGLPPVRLIALIRRVEQDVLLIDHTGIRPPHRFTASIVVDSALSDDECFEAMYSLAMALAPHIDRNSLRSLPRPYRLLRRLLNHGTVSRHLGDRLGRQFYDQISDPYDWNSRFWEQRALFESSLGNHAQARSYAEFSLHRLEHPFGFNTLGTVLGRFAIQIGDSSMLHEAVRNLEHARELRRLEGSEHPYVTFFTTMIRFGQEWGMSAMSVRLRNAFFEWHRHAERSSVFFGQRREDELGDYLREWLYLIAQ